LHSDENPEVHTPLCPKLAGRSEEMAIWDEIDRCERTTDILKDLKLLFGSVTAIPVQVFLTGFENLIPCLFSFFRVCLQIQEGPASAREFLEEFLSNWKFVDERCYALAKAEANMVYDEECVNRSVLEVDKYLDVVEVYIITLLAVALSDIEHAISWVDEATIPEEKRQRLQGVDCGDLYKSVPFTQLILLLLELLRRLHSMNYSEMTNLTDTSVSPLLPVACESFAKPLKTQNQSNGENGAKQTILKFSGQRVPCFWWFRTITLKFGNGSVLKRQALSVKKAVSDLWQLAFSYQVNPLAAVQPLPSATHGSR
ncbi:hypothetical protein RJ639_013474, partial [Escallonia herrerae]